MRTDPVLPSIDTIASWPEEVLSWLLVIWGLGLLLGASWVILTLLGPRVRGWLADKVFQ